jgi:hypothetical protein
MTQVLGLGPDEDVIKDDAETLEKILRAAIFQNQ